jgi:hypothetical protein
MNTELFVYKKLFIHLQKGTRFHYRTIYSQRVLITSKRYTTQAPLRLLAGALTVADVRVVGHVGRVGHVRRRQLRQRLGRDDRVQALEKAMMAAS